MATEILIPRLGWNMEQGVFMGWLHQDGAQIKAGDALFTLEGDKSVQEIEALESGVLRIASTCPKEGQTVPVGTLLGHIEMVGESAASRQPIVASPAAVQAPAKKIEVAAAPPQIRTAPPQQMPITPRARRAARTQGIDPAGVQGTGRHGRIRERDILAAAGPVAAAPSATPIPVSAWRKTIAQRMLHSAHTTAPVTLTTHVDATNLVNLRNQFKTAARTPDLVVPSYTDFIVKLAALALRQHPHMNSRWEDQHIVTSTEINIGIAVDTEAGLAVPVVRDAPSLPLRQLAAQTKALAEKARRRQLTAAEAHGGTFTVTNLGGFGIDAFTPIIHWPEAAILGVGRIHPQPAVVNDQVVVRPQVTLSLTFDHRLVDGAPAARFLQTLATGIEIPSAWLID